jgi:hypothetical protein
MNFGDPFDRSGCLINDFHSADFISSLKKVRNVADVVKWEHDYIHSNGTKKDGMSAMGHHTVEGHVFYRNLAYLVKKGKPVYANYGPYFWLNDALLDPGFDTAAKLAIIGFMLLTDKDFMFCQWVHPALRIVYDPGTETFKTMPKNTKQLKKYSPSNLAHVEEVCRKWTDHFRLPESGFPGWIIALQSVGFFTSFPEHGLYL